MWKKKPFSMDFRHCWKRQSYRHEESNNMILKQLKIIKFGEINNKTIEFSPDLNVLPIEAEGEKNTIFLFLKYMLYGVAESKEKFRKNLEPSKVEEPISWELDGTIWFESQGKSYRLTRRWAMNAEEQELFCEEEGKAVERNEEVWNRLLGKVSERVYENSAFLPAPKSMNRQDLAREIQNYMLSFLKTADSSMDLGRAGQMLKMWRKGYQSQKSRYQKEVDKEKVRLSTRMNELEKELDDLNERKGQIQEKQSEMETAQGRDGAEEQLGIQIQNIQRKNMGMIIAALLAVVVGIIGVVGWFQLTDEMSRMGMNVCVVAAVITILYTFAVRRKLQIELARKKKEKVRLRAQHQKLKLNQENVDETYREKLTEFTNLQNEYQEYEGESSLPTSEDMEVQALNLAMETIEELSGNIRRNTGRKIKVRGSRILNEITDGKYGEIFIDPNLNIGVSIPGQDILLEQLPVKVLELVYFAVHMAAKELQCGENVWIILDDTFSTYEENGMISVFHWLAKKRGQTILTCSGKRELEILEKEKIEYKEIRL